MIVADTGAVIALIDADDKHHETLLDLYEKAPDDWILPSAILPEVDYLLATKVGKRSQQAFLNDLAKSAFFIDWGEAADIQRAAELNAQYASLRLGLVDGCVISTAERLEARAIATLDVRHFGAVKIKGAPALYPRDLPF